MSSPILIFSDNGTGRKSVLYKSAFSHRANRSEINKKVSELVDLMNLDEKVGQMTQLNLGFLSTSEQQHDGKSKQVDWSKVQTAIAI